MPTVGCEADAIAFTEEDACSTSSSSSGDSSDGAESSNDQGLLFTADGSYSSGKSRPGSGAFSIVKVLGGVQVMHGPFNTNHAWQQLV